MAAAIGFAFSSAAMAAMSKDEYKAKKDAISANYKAERAKCDPLAGNAKDICVAEAKGREKVAKAELESSYKPSTDNTYKARVAKAEADYAVAKEKCDDKAGNDKDVCVKQAKAAEATAKGEAKAQKKTVAANKKAAEKTADAREDAATKKRDADYAVAKEKCDALAGTAKDKCVADAKAKYGK
jgi:hypothetical protein